MPSVPSLKPALSGRDIVVIGLQPWYFEIGSNCKDIARLLALHNRVLYVNLPINRKTFLSSAKEGPGVQEHCRIIREKDETLHSIGPNLWQFYPTSIVESINWLPSTGAFKAVNRINNRRFARDIRAAMERLGFRDVILFNDNDFFNGYGLKELLRPSLYVYYCRDYLRGHDYWKKHGDVLEPGLIRKADLVVANSGYLAEYCAGINPQSYDIGQGCNLGLFDSEASLPKPEDLSGIASPIIGYVGAVISYRLDEQIIRIIAEADPAWNVVLVGPEDDVFRNSSLHEMPNVHFLGRKPLEALPAYVRAFDVCINPQLLSPITIGNYPLKVDEYLAMGKPVVATRTRTMKLFENHTYLADRPEEYPALIRQALQEDSSPLRAERTAFARTHTWENSVGELGRRIVEKTKRSIPMQPAAVE